MGRIRAVLNKAFHIEFCEITSRNILQPLIVFVITAFILLFFIILAGLILKNNILVYISLIVLIILISIPIIAYFIILKTRPEDLHDEKYLLEKNKLEMSKDNSKMVTEENENSIINIDINQPDDTKQGF